MNKIRKGDLVVLNTGKDKGKRGQVLAVLEAHVLVQGLNLARKHSKANPVKGLEGGVVDKEMPVQISNVSLFNPLTEKADRVGFKFLDDGRKVRVFKSNGEVVDV